MGNCCSSPCSSGKKGEGLSDKYAWEQNVVDDTIMKTGHVTHAAIVSFSDGELRAVAPRNFRPNKKGVKTILDALKGDTSGIAQDSIVLGGGTKVNTAGKLDAGKAIYGSDGKGGGCTIFKSQTSVLVVFYDDNPAQATRLASEVAEYMEEQGH